MHGARQTARADRIETLGVARPRIDWPEKQKGTHRVPFLFDPPIYLLLVFAFAAGLTG
jgi:hypothetical protein